MKATIQRLSAVTLKIADMGKSVQFYQDVLGLELRHGGPSAGFTSLRIPNTQFSFINLQLGCAAPDWGRIIFHVSDVDAFWARLKRNGSAPLTMQFHTANKMVNQLWSNILWGQRGNFLSVPTDCPQRDERMGWMGDAQVFCRTATFNANLQAFSPKFTTDIRDAEEPSGAYTEVSPMVDDVSSSVAGWSDAGIIIPWTTYLRYGDTRIVEENWAAMEKWMAHLESANPNHLWLHERGSDEGDWLAIGSQTSKDLIATAYWAYDTQLMARMAGILHRPMDEQKYSDLFHQIQAAFDRRFVRRQGKIDKGSQTSQVLALHMQLLANDQVKPAVQALVADIKAHKWHLTTGFLGTPYLLPILSQYGYSDVAYHLLLQTTYPSWGYMIDRGATTMWERWNGDQMMADPTMNSYNHYGYGAVGE